ncbi:hypothetical protein E2C01_014997 [Portunus trituberculatus]|uniref:Uncharacterized protein n=1 Tax=Portunus trituberculatus TaxID=210409 RepID=A0A5B7DLM7_PORTR|nr:hypothetical protein [Portunus trituberculatus]
MVRGEHCANGRMRGKDRVLPPIHCTSMAWKGGLVSCSRCSGKLSPYVVYPLLHANSTRKVNITQDDSTRGFT